MWLNESLVLRGETKEEKKALNVIYQTIAREPEYGSEGTDFVDSVSAAVSTSVPAKNK